MHPPYIYGVIDDNLKVNKPKCSETASTDFTVLFLVLHALVFFKHVKWSSDVGFISIQHSCRFSVPFLCCFWDILCLAVWCAYESGYECESCVVLCIMIFFLCMLCKGGATLFRLRLSVASPPSTVHFDVFLIVVFNMMEIKYWIELNWTGPS